MDNAQKFKRQLTFIAADGDRKTLEESQLTSRSEPLIVLGEAGMGKTTLLEALCKHQDYKYVLARSFIKASDPTTVVGGAKTIVIDALDEVVNQSEGGNVDEVLSALEQAGSPKFVLACRVADWRSATGVQAISDVYQIMPLELNLQPITQDEAKKLLAASVGEDHADQVINHFKAHGLSDLFGNPQTLDLIRAVAEIQDLPVSRSALFELAIKRLCFEHSPRKPDTELGQASEDEALEAAGSAFAALILSGKAALSRHPVPEIEEDLRLAEAVSLSDQSKLNSIIASRLFVGRVGDDPDRFSYTHRSVGEYLAARWLAKKADTDRKRRRLLTLFKELSLVPSSLRGVHAWLALDPQLATDVIKSDPMGVIEYGDLSVLDTTQANLLLKSLEKLSEVNPRFYHYDSQETLRPILRPAMYEMVKSFIEDPTTSYGVRSMLLVSLECSELSQALSGTLKDLMLDPERTFHERRSAGDALTELDGSELDWASMMAKLYNLADAESIRLGLELLPRLKFQGVPDQTIVLLITAQYGLTLCEYPKRDAQRISGVMWGFRERLPDSRIGSLLDKLSDYSSMIGDSEEGFENRYNLADLTTKLIMRRLLSKSVDPLRLWRWLQLIGENQSYNREEVSKITAWFKSNNETRQAIQQYALIDADDEDNVWMRSWRLSDLVAGLTPNETDVIRLLGKLDVASAESHDRWRDLVRICPHDEERGVEVRKAAAVLVKTAEDTDWLQALGNPKIPEWKIKDENRRREHREKIEKKRAKHRKDFIANIEKLRAGHYGYVINTAKAYLSLYRDIGDGLPAHERISEWLGPELQTVAFEGFEAFLMNKEPKPTAREIANSHAKGEHWDASYILVASIAERFRTNKSLTELPSERLIATLLEARNTMILDQAKIVGVTETIENVLRSREGQWQEYWRLRIQPQLAAGKEYVDGLYQIARTKEDGELAVTLAIDWLDQYPDLPHLAEFELIDCLIRNNALDELRKFADVRRGAILSVDERCADWDAVALLVNFDARVEEITRNQKSNRGFLWTLRARLEAWNDRPTPELSPKIIAWIVTNYRLHWPSASRSAGPSSGDTNPWDATEFLNGMINRLGGMTDDIAVKELADFLNCKEDGYTEYIQLIRSEQDRKFVEENYLSPTLEDIKSILEDQPPTTTAQLQAVMIEELVRAQSKIKSHAANWPTGFFYQDGNPKNEGDCRDELLKLLGDYPSNIHCMPEGHLANGKRVDILCSINNLMLPIEIKGQWHKDLWNAADTQLDRLYSTDWRADSRGIYLVFWFGTEVPQNKKLKSRGRGISAPKTAVECRNLLVEESRAALEGRVNVVVLDMTQPPADDR